jgi:hypothetical protein
MGGSWVKVLTIEGTRKNSQNKMSSQAMGHTQDGTRNGNRGFGPPLSGLVFPLFFGPYCMVFPDVR